jgi:protoporphyrinogen oxidase
MYKNNYQRLDILGAGPAGLGVGYYAKKYGIPVSIFELSNNVGGNSRTISNGEFFYDTGAHRLHNKHSSVTQMVKELLGGDLKLVNVPSKIYHNGSMVDFPLNIINLFQSLQTSDLLKIIKENFFYSFKKNVDIKSFKDLAYQNYGPTLSELFLINYTEKLWGENSNKLDPSISGKRLKNLDFISVIKSLFFGINNTKHLDGSFFYPKYGFGTIFDELANTIGNENIFLDSKVEKIIHDGKRINWIVCAGQKPFSPGMVVDTLPLNALSKMFDPRPPDEITKCIEDIKFRDVRLCILYLNKSKFSNNASIYFPESKFPYNRIYEPKNRSKYMAPKDKTCIVIECSSSRKKTGNLESEEVFFKKIKDSLVNECLIKNEDIISYKMGFIPNAYPVIDLGIQDKIGPALSYFNSFENHILHGRNAEFKYLHTHDLLKNSENLLGKLFD